MKNVARSLTLCGFIWLEYSIAVVIVASFALILAFGLDRLCPEIYDYSAEADLVDDLRRACNSGEITYTESREMLEIYRNDHFTYTLEKWRIWLLFVVLVGISTAAMVLLFKKYRLLRFRERFGNYFFPDKT
jgi:hypothetical protein